MYLSKISIKNFRVFSDAVEVSFSKGLNLLVGENGSGKSTAVDAIRALLGENEFSRRGIIEEDFYSVFCESQKKSSESLFISGVFSNLTEAQKVEYLSWLDEDFNAKLSFEVQRTLNRRNNYKQKRWGGNSSNSFFDIEPLNDIQCVYLPALRDAERSLRTGRGSRLARFIANLSADDLKSNREKDELMPLEEDLKEFNEKAANESEIKNATELINSIVRNNSVKNKILGKKVTTGTINTIEDFAHFVYLRKYNSLECFRGSTRVLARAIQRAFFVNEVHGNSNNLYKPERLESAEWNAIIVSVQKKLIADSAVTDLNKTWSAWKKTLASCLGNIDIIPSHTIELKSIRRGMKDEKVIDTFSNSIDHDISITIETIHGCKGMSLDSVLFVSSYTKSVSSSGAHWRDWFQHNETGISEAHRLAYVAFSRAKHLLALGIPNPHSAPLSEADKQMLTDCGFEIVEIAEDRS